MDSFIIDHTNISKIDLWALYAVWFVLSITLLCEFDSLESQSMKK